MKRILVTGAAGFVGANLTRRLVHDGHQVHLLLRNSGNPWRIRDLHDKLVQHEGDLCQRDQVQEIVNAVRPEWVFHLAAYGAYSWQSDRQSIFQTNHLGTVNLVDSCLETGFEAFINTGSSSEYGYKTFAPDETSALEPNSHYALTKASATLHCRFMGISERLPLVTLRLYSVYGPYEEPGRFIPALVLHGLRDEYPPLANPRTARDFVFIDDVVDAYILAARQASREPGGIYNVGTGKQTTLLDAVEIARQVFRCTCSPEWNSFPNRQWDTDVWVANNDKIRRDLSWNPRVSLADGLRAFGQWFDEKPELKEYYACQPARNTVAKRSVARRVA